MGTIAEKLSKLLATKNAIKASIIAKGQNVSDSDTFASYPAKIDAIETGVDTSDATATAGDILSGETAYVDGKKVTGTIATKTSSDLTVSEATVSVPAGYYATNASKSVSTIAQAAPSISVDSTTGVITASVTQGTGYVSGGTETNSKELDTQAATTITPGSSDQTAVDAGKYTTGAVTVKAILAPTISVSDTGLITASTGGVTNTEQLPTQAAKRITPSKANITAVAAGKYTTGAVTVDPVPTQSKTVIPTTSAQSITPDSGKFLATVTVAAIPSTYVRPTTTKVAATYTPTTSNQTITAGTYCSGAQTIAGDADLVAGNIKSGVDIFGVRGTYTSDATATAGDILSGETAYVDGKKVIGTIATKTSSDLTVSEATVSVPAGYYASNASKSVPTTIQATPSISIDSAGLITANATQSAGYVSAGTKKATKQLTLRSSSDLTASGATVSVPAGYYANDASKSVSTVDQATPTISVDSTTGVITASVTQGSGYVHGRTATNTSELQTQAATTITPSAYTQTAVKKGFYTTGVISVAPVPTQTKSATPSKFKQTVTPDSGKFLSSVTIGAIPSRYITTSDATATASDIANGKTAYVNGSKITGNVTEVTSSDVASYDYWACAASGDDIGVNCVVDKDSLIRKDAMIVLTVPKTEFGDATAADVAAGKTFTSTAGLKVVGTGGNSGGWTYVFFSTISDQPSDDVVSSVSNNLNLNSRVRELDVTLTKEFSEAKLIYAAGFSEDTSSQTFVISPSIESITGRDYEGMYYDNGDGALSSIVSAGVRAYPELKQVSIDFMPFSSNTETLIDNVCGCIAVKFN